ncbi:hypothetical protein FNF29_06730 [Cafeteria roenbergensis]|uniref:Uncharacterized protein n=1 Tax=Cafeteria roenbergensis TaxID=33653 RepID=A0A5A8DDD8_CAFRO|nr:hypothetical protein FNF29_06730 [Cafeteria roenbergensis]KAA0161490.1 hypothetical protein FNF31_03773 [Cafeteria roenbergensis]KAA0163228.1 hypothetical protein FNF28_04378 [Cafeteria roenbergensis]|eukprot:KAA0148343.1 hypothetical protein FNF29_06730 [Cafeteria roenbergensis]
MSTRVSSNIRELVKAVGKHKKFRQLASYSVQCLEKVITPPRVGWERNLAEAFEAGAAEAIFDVLKIHAKDETVMASSTACLAALAGNPKYAPALIERGIVDVMCKAVQEQPNSEIASKMLTLVENAAGSSPEKLLAAGGVDQLTATIELMGGKNPHVTASMLRALEKVSRAPGAPSRMAGRGTIGVMLAATESDSLALQTGAVEASLRCMERLCRDELIASHVRDECEGMQRIATAIEKNRSSDRIAKMGGRALGRLASSNVGDLIRQMDDPGTSDKQRQFVSTLIANLASEEENVEKIIKSGGLPTLLRVLTSENGKSVASAARAVGRIAATDLAQVEESAGLAALVKAYDKHSKSSDVTAAVVDSVNKFIAAGGAVEDVEGHGLLSRVVATLRDEPDFTDHLVGALALIETAMVEGVSVDSLRKLSVAEAVAVAMMVTDTGNESVQLNGCRSLIYLCGTVDGLSEVMAQEGLPEHVMDLVGGSGGKASAPVVKAAMYLVTSMCTEPGHAEAIKAKGGLSVLLPAVASNSTKAEFREVCSELVESINAESEMTRLIDELPKLLTKAQEEKTAAAAKELSVAVQSMNALSVVVSNAEAIATEHTLLRMAESINALAKATALPGQEEAMAALTSLAKSVYQTLATSGVDDAAAVAFESMRDSKLPEAIITATKLHPKLTRLVDVSLGLVESFAQQDPDFITEIGGIEACIAAIRSNPSSLGVANVASSALLQIASTATGAIAVAKNGGTRQLVTTISTAHETPEMAQPIEKMLTILNRVAVTTEGADILRKQDAATIVMDVAGTMKNSAIAAEATKTCLDRLLQTSDVVKAVERLDMATEGGRVDIATLGPVLARIGHMATSSASASAVKASAGGEKVNSTTEMIIDELLKLEVPEEGESDLKRQRREKKVLQCREILPVAIGAVAAFAKASQSLELISSETIGHVGAALERSIAVRECMDVIAAASRSETSAVSIVAASEGKLLGHMVDLLNTAREPEILADAYSAMADLARHESTIGAVKGTGVDVIAGTWLDTNLDDATPATVRSAIDLLASLATTSETAEAMVSRGVLETTKAVVAQFCTDAELLSPEVLGSTASLVAAFARASPEAIAAAGKSSAIRRILRATESSASFLTDPASAGAVLDMIGACAIADPETAAHMAELGAQEIVLAIMSANGSNQRILDTAAGALRAIGTTVDVSVLTKDLEHASTALATAERFGPEMVQSVVQAMQKLGNFMVMDGVVTPENAGKILDCVSEAVGLIAESELASEDDIAYGLGSVARLAAMAPSGTLDTHNAVEVLLDVQELFSDNPKVVQAAVDCFGILTEDAAAVHAMIELGALGEITKLTARHAGDLGLQATLKSAVGRIANYAAEEASSIAASGAQGEEFIVQILDASIGDKSATDTLLTKVAMGEGGSEVLWSMLERYEVGNEVDAETAQAIRMTAGGVEVLWATAQRIEQSIVEGRVQKDLASADRGQVIGTVLQSAVNLRSGISERTTEAEQLVALDRYRQAMILLNGVRFDEAGANAFVKNKGVENLMQLLEVDILTMKPYVPMLTAALAEVIARHPVEAINNIANPTDMHLIMKALTEVPEERSVAMALLSVMSAVITEKGAKDAGVTRDVHSFLSGDFCSRWEADPQVATAVKEVLDLLEPRFSSSEQAAVRVSVDSAVVAISSALAVDVVIQDGETVYVDATTGETVDGRAYEAMKVRLADVAERVSSQSADNMVEVDTSGIRSMVETLRKNKHVANVAQSASKVLSSLSANQANCEAIAAADGIPALIDAFNMAGEEDDLVEHLVLLLARLARNEAFKQPIMDCGGVKMLVSVAGSKKLAELTLQRALGALADLVHDKPTAVAMVMDEGGVKATESAMQRFPKSARLLENAMTLLSNLTHGSEDNMLEIGQTCGDEITKVVWDFAHDKDLAKMALRALGNLANVDENVAMVVQHHSAVDNIKRAVRKNKDDEELISISLEVLGNFAASEVAGDELEGESICMHMHSDAATDTIVECMAANPFSASIQTAGMFALSELVADPVVRAECAIDKIAAVVITALKTHDWDGELIRQAAELVREFPPKGGLDTFVQASGVRMLLQALENHATNDEVLLAVAKTLAVMCAFQKEVPDIHLSFMSLDAPTVLLGVAESKMDHASVVAGMFEALAGMSVVEDAAVSIAEVGMHTVVAAINRHMNRPAVLIHTLRLVDLISLNKVNINEVVNAGGINSLFDVCVEHGPDEDEEQLPPMESLLVIKQAVATLSTISSASSDFASLMMEEGLDEVLKIFISKFDVRTQEEKDIEDAKFAAEEGQAVEEADVPDDDPILGVITSVTIKPEQLADILDKSNYSWHIAKLLEDPIRDEIERAAQKLEARRGKLEIQLAAKKDGAVEAMELLEDEYEQWAIAEQAVGAFMERAQLLEQLARECHGAMNMMGALDGINKSAALQARAKRSAALAKRDEVASDELADVKNSLCVAKLMNVWTKGRCKTFQLLLGDDLENIVWQDASTGAKRGNISLSTISKVVDGPDPVHHRGRKVDKPRCFYLATPSDTALALEPINPRNKKLWITNLRTLFAARNSAVEFTTSEAIEEAARKSGVTKKR